METNIEKLIEEVVPELASEKPRFWSLWTEGVFTGDYPPIPFWSLLVNCGISSVSFLIMLIAKTPADQLFGRYWFCAGLAIVPVTLFLGWRRGRKRKSAEVVILPSLEEVQTRILTRMTAEIKTAKKDIVGAGSIFENRIAELKKKLGEAKGTHLRYCVKTGTDLSKYANEIERSRRVKDAFEAELALLNREQEQVLSFFDDVEVFLPEETSRIEDDVLLAKLCELEGTARVARQISREMLLEVVKPSLDKLFALNTARERLLSHSIAALKPVSIERFIEATEQGAESVVKVEGALQKVAERT